MRSDGLAPYLGSQSAAHGRAKALRVLAPTFTTLVARSFKSFEELLNMNQLASALQSLGHTEAWTGTASQLAAALNAAGLSPSTTAARLSIRLRNLEPTLWWDHGLSIRFSRTGEQRLIHLVTREGLRGQNS